jgi:hypothetical protein
MPAENQENRHPGTCPTPAQKSVLQHHKQKWHSATKHNNDHVASKYTIVAAHSTGDAFCHGCWACMAVATMFLWMGRKGLCTCHVRMSSHQPVYSTHRLPKQLTCASVKKMVRSGSNVKH